MDPQRSQLSMFIRWTGLLALFAGTLWLINRLAAQADGWVPHAVSHLTGAVVGMVPLRIGLWHYQRAGRQVVGVGRIGVRLFIGGATLFTLGQLVETMSAVIEYPDAGIMHTASGVATMIGLLIALIGALMLMVTAVTGRRLPRWTFVLAIVGGAFILFAAVFGIG